MIRFLVWVVLCELSVLGQVWSRTEQQFVEMLTDGRGYDKFTIPASDTLVHVGLHLNSIINVDDKNQELELDLYLRLFWFDPRLRYDPADHPGAVTLQDSLSRRIWQPDLYFENARHVEMETEPVVHRLIKFYSSGRVWMATSHQAGTKGFVRARLALIIRDNMSTLPSSTQAVVLNSNLKPEIRTLPLPATLAQDEVLVKMCLAPILPCDRLSIAGKMRPLAEGQGTGVEGVGRVIAIGKKVKSAAIGDRVVPVHHFVAVGTWRQYCIFKEDNIAKVSFDCISDEDASVLFINPTSAYFVLRRDDLQPGDCVIQNCANGNLGRCVIHLAKQWGMKTINVVRQRSDFAQLADELKSLGADAVITDEQLCMGQIPSHLPKPKLAFDCVGGKTSGLLAKTLQDHGTVMVGKKQSGELPELDAADTEDRDIKLEYLAVTNSVENGRMVQDEVIPNFASFKFTNYEKVKMEEFEKGLQLATEYHGKKRILLELN